LEQGLAPAVEVAASFRHLAGASLRRSGIGLLWAGFSCGCPLRQKVRDENTVTKKGQNIVTFG